MKRGKKLLINASIIAIILFGLYFFSGFYFSKEKCILETMRALYGTERNVVAEYECDDAIITLLTDEEKETYSIVRTKKFGFLYQRGSAQIGLKMRDKECVGIAWMSVNENEGMLVIYRNDKAVDKVEVSLSDGREFVLEEWEQDFSTLLIEMDIGGFKRGTYKAYDASNQLVGEVYY
ncbi:MAG: hypothetical protein IJZ53_09945 [Tyzzerella sp.]|nr:hypothetical protein [Tyzzerella sp.]